MRAVSYTHLDVYKRQVYTLACKKQFCEIENNYCYFGKIVSKLKFLNQRTVIQWEEFYCTVWKKNFLSDLVTLNHSYSLFIVFDLLFIYFLLHAQELFLYFGKRSITYYVFIFSNTKYKIYYIINVGLQRNWLIEKEVQSASPT